MSGVARDGVGATVLPGDPSDSLMSLPRVRRRDPELTLPLGSSALAASVAFSCSDLNRPRRALLRTVGSEALG